MWVPFIASSFLSLGLNAYLNLLLSSLPIPMMSCPSVRCQLWVLIGQHHPVQSQPIYILITAPVLFVFVTLNKFFTRSESVCSHL